MGKGTDATWETLKYAKCEHGWSEPGTPVYRAAEALRAHKSTFDFFEQARHGMAVTNPFAPLPLCIGDAPGASRMVRVTDTVSDAQAMPQTGWLLVVLAASLGLATVIYRRRWHMASRTHHEDTIQLTRAPARGVTS